MSRVYTQEEIREQFIAHVRDIVRYWADAPQEITFHRRLEGVAFSILATIDNGQPPLGLPGFLLIPNPHKGDESFYRERRKNFYPSPPDMDCVDIAGGLHEHFYVKEKKP